MHAVLYHRTTNACPGPYLSSWISNATLDHTRNVSDSRAVVRYADYLYMTHSFQVIYACKCAQMTYRKETVKCFGVINHNHILRQAVTQIIDISYSRAVIQYVERPYTTCSCRVMSVSMYKYCIVRQLWCVFGPITRQLYLTYNSN